MKENKQTKKDREELDNNELMKELLKENHDKVEIAKEISTNKKIANVVGERLAKHRRFPPC